MKTKLLALSLIFSSQLLFAQYTDVLNNNINFEFTIEYNHYFNASSESGNSEPVITVNLGVDGGFFSNTCHTWSCEPNCYDGGGDDIYWAGSNYPFNSYWEAYYLCWEEDGPDDCTYGSGDDDYWEGWATLRAGATQQQLIYPSSNFRPCQIINSLGNGGSGWLLPTSPRFNQILQLKWRYSAGDSPSDRLNFGNIGPNQSKSDINSNRSISTVGGFAPVGYSHSGNSQYSSPDVWYSFTITESTPVTIRTNHGETDFDTYLRLWTEAGAFIAADDQSGGNNTSLISTTLCPGNYTLLVEGWQTSTGNFKVSIETGSPVSAVNAGASSSGVSCEGEADGYASWSPSGGVPPYDWEWQGFGIPGSSMSGLAAGTFTLDVTDACGNTDSETIVIDVDDNTNPVANCVSSYSVDVWSGNNVAISASAIDDGSTDNCGIDSYSLSQTTFSVSDAGNNTVTLTVTDDSGNTDQCTTTVTVNNTTGVEEAELLSNMLIYPNPSEGTFQVDLSSADLEKDATLTVVDKLGRVVFTIAATQSNISVDLGGVSNGVYLVRVENNHVSAAKRMVVLP